MVRVCKHCELHFEVDDKPKGWMANHSRWCKSNPKRTSYTNSNDMSKARAAISPDSIEKRRKSISDAHKKGNYDHVNRKTFLGRKHSAESIQKMKQAALNSKHRRLRRGIVNYNGIMLDSSWELALAKRLDTLNIKWTRPDPIPWIDQHGICHNYFPDFYLPDYNLYLDPKNKRARYVQREKINFLLAQYCNICIINTLDECLNFNIG